jgi:endonuclease/exonuclease/phosphatase family metal-dependent hydrolase
MAIIHTPLMTSNFAISLMNTAGQFAAMLNRILLLVITVTTGAESSKAVETAAADRDSIRVATFNVSLYGRQPGQIRQRLSDRSDRQAQQIARIVQTIRPDILLVNELDYELDGAPARLLEENYFAVGQVGTDGGTLEPIHYPHWFSAPSNTGIDSKLDLNRDGQLGSGNDAWGYGVYPGQYAMTVFSRFPIDTDRIRTFQNFLWKDLPGAIKPVDPDTGQPYYPEAIWNQLRLSSKNHIDVPIKIDGSGGKLIHLLASHPTPPVFDGPEDRNGARNHDEVEFWNRYLQPDGGNGLVDDEGNEGGLSNSQSFVIAGDLNADPVDGSGRQEAIRRLTEHDRVGDVVPMTSAVSAEERRERFNGQGNLAAKTADFGRNGYMRADYVLPSSDLKIIDSGIFWPASSDPRSEWIQASDHRLVWIEIALATPEAE